MTTSVGTKVRKKQSSKQGEAKVLTLHAPPAPPTSGDIAFERATMDLESACMRILDDPISAYGDESDALYWHHRFKNIVTPVSMALVEYKGPRRFHYHYRHRADDESVLHPVLEDRTDLLAQVCEYALSQCAAKLVGIHETALINRQRMLEGALRTLLVRYREMESKKEELV